MKILVVGCGRMGAELAYRLFERGHEVCIIDNLEESFRHLPPDFTGRIYEGEVLNYDVLHRGGIESCDAVAAVTNSDAINLVVAHIARERFKVKHVVARNFDPSYRELYELFNFQVISATGWAAQRLEEMIYHGEVRTVFSAGNGEVEVYEVTIPEIWNGHSLAKILTDEVVPVSLTRAGKAMIPDSHTVLLTFDILHVSATLHGIQSFWKRILKGE